LPRDSGDWKVARTRTLESLRYGAGVQLRSIDGGGRDESPIAGSRRAVQSCFAEMNYNQLCITKQT